MSTDLYIKNFLKRRYIMQFWYLWFIIILCCFIIPASNARRMRQIRRARHNRRKRSNGGITMNELIKTFIGKNVIISGDSSVAEGTITKIEDNWIEVVTHPKGQPFIADKFPRHSAEVRGFCCLQGAC